MTFVQAKDLKHIQVKGTVHLWQLKEGEVKSLTNDPKLQLLEDLQGFNESLYWRILKQKVGLKNGFYFAEHSSKTANVINADNWNDEVEAELLKRGYIAIKKSKPNKGFGK